MDLEQEQQSTADQNVELNSETENQEIESQEGVAETPETETDEQKNARVLAEEAERAQLKEERRQSKVEKRIAEITADKYEARRLADAERQRADDLERRLRELESNRTTSTGELQRDQYENYEDYLEAKAEYKAAKIVQESLSKFETTQKERVSKSEQEQSMRQTEKQFIERRLAVEKDYPDYREVLEDWEPNIPASLVETIVQLEEGPLITYHLAKNPSLEAKFHNQPPHMHGIILGQMIASLKSPPKVTSAPSAGKPVSTSKAVSSTEPPADPEHYRAWADKHLR